MGGSGSGRARKPTALKNLHGNPGKRKNNKREPKPSPGVPEMPNLLKGEAAAEWKRIVPVLEKMGVLTIADGKALAAYCSVYAQWIKAEAAIQKFGIVTVQFIDRAAGVVTLKKNPAVQIKSESLKLMKSFLTEFGLTPASRAKVAVTEGRDLVPDVKSQDALEDFLSREPASEVTQ
jgi:P27 family predicted phage terminase small subunit